MYSVRHSVTGQIRDYHAKILAEYHFSELTPQPEQVARLEEAYKEIKEVIDHKFSPIKEIL